MHDFLQIFVTLQSTKILIESSFWLGMYISYILKCVFLLTYTNLIRNKLSEYHIAIILVDLVLLKFVYSNRLRDDVTFRAEQFFNHYANNRGISKRYVNYTNA